MLSKQLLCSLDPFVLRVDADSTEFRLCELPRRSSRACSFLVFAVLTLESFRRNLKLAGDDLLMDVVELGFFSADVSLQCSYDSVFTFCSSLEPAVSSCSSCSSVSSSCSSCLSSSSSSSSSSSPSSWSFLCW